LEVGITGHNFGRGTSMDHSTKVWLQLAQWFLRRRLKCEMLTNGRRMKSDDNSSPAGELKNQYTSTFRNFVANLPVSAILVFPRIFRYLQYSYFGNDQYLLVLQIHVLENSGRYWETSIYQYLYQYCRYW
jgi:hypothetical protein